MAPKHPTIIFAVPAQVLDNDILNAVLFLCGDKSFQGLGSSLGLFDLAGGHGLATCDAHDDLADAGVGEFGDGCCTV